jgi:hypothetical protein
MENITVNAHCSLTIDHFKPTVNKIDHLDIKTFGEMKITTDREALTTIEGTTLTVRSGSLVISLFSYYVIKFVTDLWQVDGFPPPVKLTAMI